MQMVEEKALGVTSPGSLGWTKALEALEGLDGDQSDDGF